MMRFPTPGTGLAADTAQDGLRMNERVLLWSPP
jgi:hypothetical protein